MSDFMAQADGLITQAVYEAAISSLGQGTPTREDIVIFAAGVFASQERGRLAGHALDALLKLRPVVANAEQGSALEDVLAAFGAVFGVDVPA